jgi:hypothetical protein
MSNDADELKEAKREIGVQRARADYALKIAQTERDKRKALQKKLRVVETESFRKGSAVTVAAYMTALGDDGLMSAFQDHVRANVQKRPINAAKAAKLVDALCARFSTTLAGTDELIAMVYAPQLGESK